MRKAEAIRKKNGPRDENEANEEQVLDGGIGGTKRISVKIKYHDPIPDIEWWDLQIIAQKRKNYLPKEIVPESLMEEEQQKMGQAVAEGEEEKIIKTGIENIDIEKLKHNTELLQEVVINDDYVAFVRKTIHCND